MDNLLKESAETHLFIVWHHARDSFQRILDDLQTQLQVLMVYEIEWDPALYLQNLIAFYAHSQKHLSDENIATLMELKRQDIGVGGFYVILSRDNAPVYS